MDSQATMNSFGEAVGRGIDDFSQHLFRSMVREWLLERTPEEFDELFSEWRAEKEKEFESDRQARMKATGLIENSRDAETEILDGVEKVVCTNFSRMHISEPAGESVGESPVM